MTQAVRHAGWDDGVRATAICPGAIDTDLIANLPGVTSKADRLRPETVAGIVAFILTLPNQASVPEFIANTRLETLDMKLEKRRSMMSSQPGNRDCLLHPTTHVANHARGDLPGRIITGGEGVYVIDRDGNQLLDAFACALLA
jgi:hypothetical protein